MGVSSGDKQWQAHTHTCSESKSWSYLPVANSEDSFPVFWTIVFCRWIILFVKSVFCDFTPQDVGHENNHCSSYEEDPWKETKNTYQYTIIHTMEYILKTLKFLFLSEQWQLILSNPSCLRQENIDLNIHYGV